MGTKVPKWGPTWEQCFFQGTRFPWWRSCHSEKAAEISSVTNSSSGLIFVKIRAQSGRLFSRNPGEIRTEIRAKILWLSPFCDLVHIQSVIELFAKRQNNALICTKSQRRQSQKPWFSPGFLRKSRPDCARIFTKMNPDEELVTLDSWFASVFVKFNQNMKNTAMKSLPPSLFC